MAIDHYENFPVASVLLPKHLVPAVEAIYAFARSADDLADEGDAAPAERLASLAAYEAELDAIEKYALAQFAFGKIVRPHQSGSPMFVHLGRIVAQYHLPVQPMRNLLSAFKQDVVTTRYRNFDELLDYCRRSANPVGVLMLSLYQEADERNVHDSDAICSALQLINFWQDVAIDRQKDRIYIPLEDLERFQVPAEQLDRAFVDANWTALMAFEVQRARALMMSGASLPLRLPGRIGLELRMVVQGGLRILEKIEEVGYDVFRQRPKLDWRDWLLMAWRAIWMRRTLE